MALKNRKPVAVALDCHQCRQFLPDYIHMELTNQPADVAYPQVALHLESCAACALAYVREFDRQGLAQSVTALQQVGHRAAAVAKVLDEYLKPSDPLAALFVPVAAKVQRLMATIPIWVSDTRSAFGDLAAAFSLPIATALQEFAFSSNEPQLALRSDTDREFVSRQPDETKIELLKLPYPERDLVITVSIGAVVNAQSTLLVQVQTLSQRRPLPHTRVILYDQAGEPLEMRTLDAHGLTDFGPLALNTYLIQILHEDQRMEFAVTLMPYP